MLKPLTAAMIAVSFSASAFAAQTAAQPHDGMQHGEPAAQTDPCTLPMGEGVIHALDFKTSKLNLTHKPIEAIGWPEMTMDFNVLKQVDLTAFGEGENVHFLLTAEKDKSYSIAAMCSLDVDDGAHEACMAQMNKTSIDIASKSGAACAANGAGEMDHSGHH